MDVDGLFAFVRAADRPVALERVPDLAAKARWLVVLSVRAAMGERVCVIMVRGEVKWLCCVVLCVRRGGGKGRLSEFGSVPRDPLP